MHRIPLLLSLLCACGAPPSAFDLARPVDSAAALLSDAGAVDAASSSRDMVSLPPSRVVVEYSVVDGQRLPIGYYDTTLRTKCVIWETVAGARCVPAPEIFAFINGFADSECSIKIALGFKGCLTPTYANESLGGVCPALRRTYIVDKPLVGTTIYAGIPGSCIAGTVPTGYSAFTVGAELDPTTLSPGSYVH